MRGVGKFALLLAVLALLGVGLAACGSDDSGDSTATSTAEATTTSPTDGGADPEAGEKGATGEGSGGGSTTEGNEGGSSGPAPKTSVKGEGSDSFRVQGGDNSIQDYGEEAGSSDLEQAEAVVKGYLNARAAQDWTKQCGYLAKATIEPLEQLAAKSPKLKGASCPVLLKEVTAAVPVSALANPMTGALASLRTKGENSFALFRSNGTPYFMLMAQEDGEWKIASLAPTEFP